MKSNAKPDDSNYCVIVCGFLIARSIQLENWGFSPSSTECKNLLYLLDNMSSKAYKMNFLDKIDEKKNDKMKLIILN